jgi:hypothetical protein
MSKDSPLFKEYVLIRIIDCDNLLTELRCRPQTLVVTGFSEEKPPLGERMFPLEGPFSKKWFCNV